ncbi:MAG: twin-arginine translocase subunit TatC [bacterium]|nr:twin-arginine translocase subunit TatC [bacterium]
MMERTPDTPEREPWDEDYAHGPLDQPQGDASGPPEPPEPPEPPTPSDEDPGAMGLLDHLAELRSVLFQSALAGLAATILCWFWSASLLDLLILPIKDQGVYFTAPNEAFLVRLKISAAVGLFVVAPFIFFKLYGFVLPGLYGKERKVVTPLLLSTTLLFYTGVAFAFLVVIPQVMRFLLSFGTEVMEPLIGVGPYFGFVTRLCLAFGLVFQLPLLVLVLSAIGLVNPRMLLRTWRYAIVLIFILSAALTPPDIASQIMMAGPVLVLYFGSVLVSLVVTRRRGNED